MRVMCGGHFWQLGSIASNYRNYRWVILVAFWPKHGLRSNLRVPNFKNVPWGACPRPPYIACSDRNSHTSLKELAPALADTTPHAHTPHTPHTHTHTHTHINTHVHMQVHLSAIFKCVEKITFGQQLIEFIAMFFALYRLRFIRLIVLLCNKKFSLSNHE